jgi:hypothetical protein
MMLYWIPMMYHISRNRVVVVVVVGLETANEGVDNIGVDSNSTTGVDCTVGIDTGSMNGGER